MLVSDRVKALSEKAAEQPRVHEHEAERNANVRFTTHEHEAERNPNVRFTMRVGGM